MMGQAVPEGLHERGPSRGGSGAMCYVQKSLACYVLCKFLFTLLCEIKIGCYAEVQPVLCAM